MAVQTVEQIKRLPPYLEGLQKRLLQTMFGIFDGDTQPSPGLIDKPLDLPETQIAGLDPLQIKAMQEGEQMFGSYRPLLDAAQQQQQLGVDALSQGLGMLDPSQGVQKFMNPYQEAVIDEANRLADIQANKAKTAAIRSGAFGGSREGIMRAEGQRARQANIGRLLQQGYQDALKSSQQAAKLMGGLGQAIGSGATQLSDIARLQQQLGGADIGLLSQLGGMGQAQTQAQLQAQKQNQLQKIMSPFTSLELGQKLLQGMPSGNFASTFTSTLGAGGADPFVQGIGMGSGVLGSPNIMMRGGSGPVGA